ncbi:hypothetical protein AAHA92_21378 [Salvia divinorum]|uniref:Uncharacterized protein n=1 Tax=Salvia divinorum TaxID=28513 RepID=A0ABD1GN19_SALDI
MIYLIPKSQLGPSPNLTQKPNWRALSDAFPLFSLTASPSTPPSQFMTPSSPNASRRRVAGPLVTTTTRAAAVRHPPRCLRYSVAAPTRPRVDLFPVSPSPLCPVVANFRGQRTPSHRVFALSVFLGQQPHLRMIAVCGRKVESERTDWSCRY